jgi:uncharacterized protein (TIGR02996 family)
VTVARLEVLAFLDDIKAHRTDKTPRLVLADWLEERDDPRGTLLRIQWEWRSPDLLPARRLELGEQERALIQRHQDLWLGLLKGRVSSWAFQRGLVQLQSSPDALVRENSPELLSSEELAWVETIRLYGDTATAAQYAATRTLQTACVLDCSWCRLRAPELAGLAEAAPFPYLAELILNTCNIGNAGLEALAGSAAFPALREVRLSGCGIDDPALEMFAGGALLGQLHVLDLRNNRIGSGGITALATRPLQLRELSLMHNQLDDDVVPRFLSSAALNQLHVLDLRGNRFSERVQERLRERFGPRVRLGN